MVDHEGPETRRGPPPKLPSVTVGPTKDKEAHLAAYFEGEQSASLLGSSSTSRSSIRAFFRPTPVSMTHQRTAAGSVSTSAIALGTTHSLETTTADNFEKNGDGTLTTTTTRQRVASSPIPQETFARRAMTGSGTEFSGDSPEGSSDVKPRFTSPPPHRTLRSLSGSGKENYHPRGRTSRSLLPTSSAKPDVPVLNWGKARNDTAEAPDDLEEDTVQSTKRAESVDTELTLSETVERRPVLSKNSISTASTSSAQAVLSEESPTSSQGESSPSNKRPPPKSDNPVKRMRPSRLADQPIDVVSGTTPTASSVTTDRPTTNLETTTPKPPHTDRSIKNELAPDILEPPFVPVHRMKTESRASESSTANSHRTKGDSVPATSDTPPIALDRPLPPSTPTPQAQLPPQPKPASKPLEGIAAIAQSLAVGSAKPSPSHTPMSPPAARPRSKADAPQIREELGDRPVMMVNNRPFIKLAQIGKGGSSKVYRVLTPLNKIFALKRVTYDPNDSAIATSYLNEVRLLGRLAGNPHIVRLFDAEHNPSKGTLTMVMECGEVDLATMLLRRRFEPFDVHFVGFYWRQMLEAVQVLHDEKIVHSDLKPANFLLVEGALKLIDFGIANAIANDTTNIHREGQLGTANYMPPEAIASNPGSGGLRKLGRASDVWSLGCILYQMVYGKTPFSDTLNVYQKLNLITNRSHKIPFPETTLSPLDVKKQPASVAATSQSSNNIPAGAAGSESSATTLTPLNDAPPAIVQKTIIVDPQLVDMMQGCLRYDAKDRFTIPELLDHPFVRSSSAGYCPTIATTSPPGSTSTLQSNSLSLDSVMAIMKRTLALGPDPAPDKLKEQAATILSHLQHRNK